MSARRTKTPRNAASRRPKRGTSAQGPKRTGEPENTEEPPGAGAVAAPEADPDDEAAAAEPGFPIAGIGGSAGALPALQDFLLHMPAECGLGFVVIVHTDPNTPSLLPELLGRCTQMPVKEAAEGDRVEPNHVYVGPPGRDVTILDGVLSLQPSAPRARGVRLPVDALFRSLAEDQRHRAVGIVLSGTGADGTLGLAAIRAESGLALAQDPSTAGFGGMPSSAISAGAVDFVLPTGAMPDRLVAHAALLAAPGRKPAAATVGRSDFDRILALIHRLTGRDFSSYKRGTLQRRVARRMNLHQISQLADYVRLLEEKPTEVDALWKDWLIGVSHFFRDPDAFAALESALPQLVAERQSGSTLRIWIPGCATGEEAYSIAILAIETAEVQRKALEIQVFATDLDSRSIDAARSGWYPEGIAADVGEERLRRFFLKEERHYRVKKEVRDLIVFAVQDVLHDPPFTRMDLISCRNLLIYLTTTAQNRLLPLFHYSLNPGGLLLLGSSESITGAEELFAGVDRRWKLFRRKETRSSGRPALEWASRTAANLASEPPAAAPKLDLADLLRRHLAESYGPPALIVDERGQIEQIHGRTGLYLEPAPGRASMNVVEMAREGLRAPIAAALREVTNESAEAVTRTTRVRTNGELTAVKLTIRRLQDAKLPRPLLVVSFEEGAGASRGGSAGKRKAAGKAERDRAVHVEEDLRTTRTDLQSTIEELQAANEELASANEEVQSVNEELQSTNEQLQTSKEETQSLNEELQTVNAELAAKVRDLQEANDDLLNLINCTDIAMIFLDNRLRVKRFTPEAQRLFRLIGTDVGRPLADLTTSLDYPDLLADAERALETLSPVEKEVRSSNGAWYGVRIRLYRTSRNAIEGLVVVFSDVSPRRAAEEHAQRARGFVEAVADGGRAPLLVLDAGLRVLRANRAFYETFALAREQTQGRLVYELADGQWDVPGLRERLEKIRAQDAGPGDFEIAHEFPGLGFRRLLVHADRAAGIERDAPELLLLAIEDASGRTPPGARPEPPP